MYDRLFKEWRPSASALLAGLTLTLAGCRTTDIDRGDQAFKKGDYPGALTHYRHSVRQEPGKLHEDEEARERYSVALNDELLRKLAALEKTPVDTRTSQNFRSMRDALRVAMTEDPNVLDTSRFETARRTLDTLADTALVRRAHQRLLTPDGYARAEAILDEAEALGGNPDAIATLRNPKADEQAERLLKEHRLVEAEARLLAVLEEKPDAIRENEMLRTVRARLAEGVRLRKDADDALRAGRLAEAEHLAGLSGKSDPTHEGLARFRTELAARRERAKTLREQAATLEAEGRADEAGDRYAQSLALELLPDTLELWTRLREKRLAELDADLRPGMAYLVALRTVDEAINFHPEVDGLSRRLDVAARAKHLLNEASPGSSSPDTRLG